MSALSKTALKAAFEALPTPITRASLETLFDNTVDSYQDTIPQLTTAQIAALTPTLNMIVYNTDINRNQFYNGTAFVNIPSIFDTIPTEFTEDVDVDLDTHYLQFGDAVYGYGLIFGDFTPFGGNPDSFSMKWDSILFESVDTMNIISATSIDLQPEDDIDIFLKTGKKVHVLDESLADTFHLREDGILVLSKYASLNYADDTAAAAGGVPLGGVYQNAGALRVRIV
jgi:hypothetical protein